MASRLVSSDPELNRFEQPTPPSGVPRSLECLPSLQHDPNRPEDVLKVDADEDGNGGDDAADCMRYLVATSSRVVVQRKLRGL